MPLTTRSKIYFASDFHFGIPDRKGSLKREALFVRWLDEVKTDAAAIYLMGDLFDFWFEYKTVIPRGYVRLLGKLAELADAGIEIHLFRGNHDIWAFNYLEQEIGIQLHRKPEVTDLLGKKFFLAHGDGLGPGDYGYKLLKKTFECRFNQWVYRWIHPDFGGWLGNFFSGRSRLTQQLKQQKEPEYKPHFDNEAIVIFSREHARSHPEIDYYIFGHLHCPAVLPASEKAQCIILGDWVSHFSYAVFDGNELKLQFYPVS